METTLSPEQTEAINKVIAEELSVLPAQISSDAKFIEDLGADSLMVVELILALEDRFGVTIPDELTERCITVGELYEALSTLLPQN